MLKTHQRRKGTGETVGKRRATKLMNELISQLENKKLAEIIMFSFSDWVHGVSAIYTRYGLIDI